MDIKFNPPKIIILISLFCFNADRLTGKSNPGNSLFQFDVGMSRCFKTSDKLNGIQTGLRWYPAHGSIYLGMQDIYCYSNKKYNWPDIGDYRYTRNINCLSPMVGVNFFRDQRIDLEFNVRFNCVNYTGKLKTDNPRLREYLLNRYGGYNGGLGFSTRVSYKITTHIGTYVDISHFRMEKKTNFFFLGLGVSYNLVNL
jgi:hypothetical protein